MTMTYKEYEKAITSVDWAALFEDDDGKAQFVRAIKAGGDALKYIEMIGGVGDGAEGCTD